LNQSTYQYKNIQTPNRINPTKYHQFKFNFTPN